MKKEKGMISYKERIVYADTKIGTYMIGRWYQREGIVGGKHMIATLFKCLVSNYKAYGFGSKSFVPM